MTNGQQAGIERTRLAYAPDVQIVEADGHSVGTQCTLLRFAEEILADGALAGSAEEGVVAVDAAAGLAELDYRDWGGLMLVVWAVFEAPEHVAVQPLAAEDYQGRDGEFGDGMVQEVVAGGGLADGAGGVDYYTRGAVLGCFILASFVEGGRGGGGYSGHPLKALRIQLLPFSTLVPCTILYSLPVFPDRNSTPKAISRARGSVR